MSDPKAKKGGPRPTALPQQLAVVADKEARYWTALGTIGRALTLLTADDQLKLLRALLRELEAAHKALGERPKKGSEP